MKHTLIRTLLLAALTSVTAGAVLAKLPALSDDAKAKADEAKAKAAHGDKLASFQLCKAMDKVADGYQAAAKQAGKPASAPVATPACADPGAFVYPPPAAASGASGAAAVAVAAAPAKPPLEAAGAHSPPKTANAPPSSMTPAAQLPAKK